MKEIEEIINKATEVMKELTDSCKKLAQENKELHERIGFDEKEKPCAFDCLAVTNVQVFPLREGVGFGKIKALASIVLNDQIQIRGLRVIDGENGLFVGYPNDPFYKGDEFRSLVSPLTRLLREHIENCVLEKYNATVS